MDGSWVYRPANWLLLRDAHETEENKLMRYMPRMSAPVFCPGPFAKQNVSLAWRPFSDSTTKGFAQIIRLQPDRFPDGEWTLKFLLLIQRYYKLSNVQYYRQGTRTKDADQHPFRSAQDPRMGFLKELEKILLEWIRISRQLDAGNYH